MKGVSGRHVLSVFLGLLIALPQLLHAQVAIDEIMYDPSGSNTGREWIELYNAGAADVTMVGGTVKGSWRVSDGSNHTLTDPSGGVGQGSLTIPAGGYLVISSDPSTFAAEYPGAAYSIVKSPISLKSSGGTVSLLDGTGATIDSVAYESSMGGSGDGSSLQKQSDGSWIAALPTPGAANSATPYVTPSDDSNSDSQSDQTDQSSDASTTTQTSQSQISSPESSYVPPPAPSLYADPGGDRTVIVGADVEFDGEAYDKDQNLLDPTTVRFMWNFGDGATAEGPAVLHHFSYPGRYAVTLTIGENKTAVEGQAIVTAEPAALSLSLLQDGGVEIRDLAGHDLDLSEWIMRQDDGTFASQFILPEDSKILSGSSMEISPQTLSFRASSSTMLEYPNGVLALAMGETTAPANSASAEVQNAAAGQRPAAAPTSSASSEQIKTIDAPLQKSAALSDDPTVSAQPSPSSADAIDAASGSALSAAAAASKPGYFWWIGIAALALAAGAGLLAAKQFKKREWDVVEDTDK